ncbi:MAG TPA: peptide chain release factor N(5)-glutamine methyltransferase [Steroidobacteraceae bacterium]|jgi:release factor glutamine methyltransferase|nr:peptide chain release factor N(5)-glutamine methyltransferase [Steroidobacteraceae bacterium]
MTAETVDTLLEEGCRTLPSRLDAQLLLAHVLQVPRAQLHSHPEASIGAAQAASYRVLLGRRLAGEPLAYLTGRREFWSLDLVVTPAVLIPRPETELLVQRALACGAADEARVADLGTGSGAVALALARERPRWRIVATDVSAAALDVARRNAAALGLTRIEFLQGSWFEPLGSARFELLVSNPPYVAAGDAALTDPSLAREPRLALTPGPDALTCLRVLAHGAAAHLEPGGWLLLEHGATQGEAVRNELVLAGFAHVRSHRDLARHERTTEGQR